MDFRLSEEQQMLRESARRFLDKAGIDTYRRSSAQNGGFDAVRWQAFADMGWLAAALPEDCGGLGGDAVEAALLMEEFGRALAVDPLWGIALLAARTLLAADRVRAAELLPALAAGELKLALAHHEPQARGVITQLESSAHPRPGGWTLCGHKSLVMAGNVADRYLISARTAGRASDRAGISLFLVDRDAPGLTRRDIRLVDNRWCADLVLDDVQIDARQLVGTPGDAGAALEHGHDFALLALCAEAVGVMEQAMWLTRDYLRTRKQFGVTLSSFQSLQHRMAEMLIELELARSVVFRALASLDLPLAERRAALSLAKVKVGQAGRFVCAQAIQLHGGIGITEECSVGHYFKRMTVLENELGSASFHLQQLALRERSDTVPALTALSTRV